MVHANERVDIDDFVRSANDYTSESLAFNANRSLLDRRARILDGFRVEVADQTSNPGQITVYNGNAFDRDGKIINNEDQANAAKTITLSGASQTFSVEIEFTESETDTDARAFWDPTFDQPSPIPDGQEFSINATTRLSPDWQIVTPVSTTGFDVVTDPNSNLIPLIVLVTDSSNQINTAAPGAGFTQEFASTSLEDDIASGVAAVRVLDARLFPDTGTFNLDVGDASVEGPFTITSVDRDNGIISFAGGPTASSHNAGAIVRMASGVARFVPERTASFESLTAPGQPDVRQRIYQADEIRGTALSTSKDTFGARSDLQLRSLKDHVDYLSAQIRELKFGSTRPDVVSQAPPTSFSATPRHFDAAGGVTGARAATVTIGDGTNTFGDYNGTTDAPFTAAVADLVARGGGRLFVKAGTYTFANEVTATVPIEFVGAGQDVVDIVSNVVGNPALSFTHTLFTEDFSLLQGVTISVGTGADEAAQFTSARVVCKNVVFSCEVGIGSSASIIATSCRFEAPATATACISGASLNESTFDTCRFVSSTIPAVSVVSLLDTLFSHCFFDTSDALVANTVSHLSVKSCDLDSLAGRALDVASISNDVYFSDCKTGGSAGNIEFFRFVGNATNIRILDSTLSIVMSGTTTGSPGELISFQGTAITDVVIRNCNFITGSAVIDCVSISNTAAVVTDFEVSSCRFSGFFRGVYIPGGASASGESIKISKNYFDGQALTHEQHALLISNGAFEVLFDGNKLIDMAAGSVLKRGVTVIGANGSPSIQVIGNVFDEIGSSSALTETAGVFISKTSATAFDLLVRGNNCKSVSSGGSVYGIRVLGNTSVASQINISHNIVDTIQGTLGSGFVAGISVEDCDAIVVSNNQVSANVESIGTPTVVAGICIDSCSGVCSGNLVSLPTVDGVSGLQAGIYVDSDTILIDGNIIRALSSAADFGVRLSFTSRNAVTVIRNHIHMNGNTVDGIHGVASGAGVDNLVVDNNHIGGLSNTSTSTGITLSLGDGAELISVSGNTVEETTYDNDHSGIRITGGSTTAAENVRVNNNIVRMDRAGGPSTRSFAGSGQAIYLTLCNIGTVSNNVVTWAQTSPEVLGTSIQLEDSSLFVVSGNIVLPNNDDVTGDEILINGTASVGGLVIGNMVGGTGATGTISIIGSYGKVQQTAGVTDDLNKISGSTP
jgi:hypothetical protein